MLQNKILNVFSTNRKIRKFLNSFGDEILPKTMSICDFLDNCLYVENLLKAEEIEQVKSIYEAILQVKSMQDVLNFPKNFFEFLKNREYIFSFFKEISSSKKNIDDLKNNDIYAQYDEHLEILKNLFDKYCEILAKKNLYDDITITKIYKINYEFLQNYDLINIEIDGTLSDFEFEILEKISKLCEIKIIFYSSVLNREILVEKLEKLCEIKIPTSKNDERFCLNLRSKKLEKLENLYKNQRILHKEFENENLMAAYVFEKVSTFINQNIAPEDICVILPDENFAKVLKNYDVNNLLNFAMGQNIKDTIFYELLKKLIEISINKTKLNLNENYLQNSFYKIDEIFFNLMQIDKNFILEFEEIYDKFCDFEKFKEIILKILDFSNLSNLAQKFESSFMQIEIFLKYEKQKFKDLLDLFMVLINKIPLDDVNGGKVVVMGVLESRGVDFKACIIAGFDDENVPKRSSQDMFLNSKIRQKAGFISFLQRENLQRFYYQNLIFKSKITAITNVKNDEKTGSRFLKKFNLIKDEEYLNDDYLNFFTNLNKNLQIPKQTDENFSQEHNFFEKPLSFSRLETFLDCKRKYFYSYVKKIKDLKTFETDSRLKGSILHESLSKVYEENKAFIFEKFKEIYTKNAKNAEINDIEIALNLKKFENNFALKMKEIEIEGYKFYKSEQKITRDFEISPSFVIQIEGRIDRIDKNDKDEFLLIDYKSNKIDKNSLQLPFYEALLNQKCEKKFFIIKTMSFDTTLKTIDDLKEAILSIKSEFDKGIIYEKQEKSCPYCPYKIICKGEI